MLRRTLVVAALTLGGCSAALGERVHEQFHQAISAGSAPLVKVDNVAGSVKVETWSKPVVEVYAVKSGYDAAALRGLTIEVSRDADAITIATHYAGGNHNGGVRYTITVPQAASLDIANTAGEVRVAGATGNVRVQTQTGTIDARLERVEGDRTIDLRATTGTLVLRIAPESSADVEAQSVVGSFSNDFSGIESTRTNIVGFRATGKIGSGVARIHLETTTGAISLRSLR